MGLSIYIAGPLFSKSELEFNKQICETLEVKGYEVFLPQRDGKDLSQMLEVGLSFEEANRRIFESDMKAVRECDLVVFVMDGRVPDEGACVEVGYAYGLGKECIGLKTDSRSLMGDLDNPMIVGVLKSRIFRSIEQLVRALESLNGDASKITRPNLIQEWHEKGLSQSPRMPPN